MYKISSENKKWLLDNGYIGKDGRVTFSDRFISILSGTTREGNSLKAPLQAIENYGLIPKSMLPANSSMNFDQFHDKSKITQEMLNLGQEFKKRFPINYEKVYEVHYSDLYEGDMIIQAGYAWPQPVNGVYPRVEYDPNHVWMGICKPLHTIFDNYIDNVDGDFIKKLAPDYNMLDYGYRVFISAENKVINNLQKQFLWSKILEWFKDFYKL